jgi:thymidylate synthase ThyX
MDKIHRNIDAKIILASENPAGQKLVTAVLRYPRWLHSEIMTHRAFSRNAASSRAIPVEKILKMVAENPAMPEYWGGEKPGMQSGAQLEGVEREECKQVWQHTGYRVTAYARDLLRRGLHKSLVNRLLEPWMPYTVLVSATSWDNFFALRAHKDAMPEFQILAYRMLDAYLKVDFQELEWGNWHIPFGDQMPAGLTLDEKIRVAIARAARLSYLTFEGELDVKKDLALYEKLMVGEPLHASPAEHVAQATPQLYLHSEYGHPSNMPCEVSTSRTVGAANTWALPYDTNMVHQGNFEGFTQYRKMQKNECVHKADLKAIWATKPDWILP